MEYTKKSIKGEKKRKCYTKETIKNSIFCEAYHLGYCQSVGYQKHSVDNFSGKHLVTHLPFFGAATL